MFRKLFIILILLFVFSCSNSSKRKRTNDSNKERVRLQFKLKELLSKKDVDLIFRFVDCFDLFLENQYSELQEEDRMIAYLRDYINKEKEAFYFDNSCFEELKNEMIKSGLINEFIVETNKYLKVDNRVYSYYDSIYYKQFSEHYKVSIDSIIYSEEVSFINNEYLKRNIGFHNPFNSVYYSLSKSCSNSDGFFNNMMGENILFNYSLDNLCNTLLEKRNIDVNNIHYRVYIAFEMVLF